MIILPNGNVGIGTTNPGNPLAVNRSADGVIIDLESADAVEGTISISGNTTSYNAFTGSHYAWTDETIEKGMLVSLTEDNKNFHGNPNSEILYGITKSTTANDSKILGVYLSLQSPDQTADLDNPHLVAAVGNMDAWIADNGQNITVGDYLISSDVPGHAQKDKQEYPISYIIARAAEPIDWSKVSETVNGVKHKKISVLFGNFTRMPGFEELEERLSQLTVAQDPVTGQIVQLDINQLKSGLASLGLVIDENGVLVIDSLKAGKLEVGTQAKPTGITLYDETTGEPYCLKIKNGQTVTEAGECENAKGNNNGQDSASMSGNSGSGTDIIIYYYDNDGDGYGVTNNFHEGSQPAGYVPNSDDCDDWSADVNPGAEEICGDGIDNNCDGVIDCLAAEVATSEVAEQNHQEVPASTSGNSTSTPFSTTATSTTATATATATATSTTATSTTTTATSTELVSTSTEPAATSTPE